MAAASAFNVGLYGEIEGQPPYSGANPFTRATAYTGAQIATHNLPVAGTAIHPVSPGQLLGNNYIYSIIEVLPTGLNVHSKKYAAITDVATLATLRG